MESKQKNKFGIRQVIYIFLFSVSALILLSPFFFKINYSEFKSLGLLGIAILNFFSGSTLFFPVPGFIATGIGGKLYNPIIVAIFSAAGSTLGEGVAFIFGYSSKKITSSQKSIIDSIAPLFHHKYAPLVIVLFAFVPNPFFDALGILAGAALFPARKFFILVFAGRFLRDIIIASIGHSI